MLRVEDAQQLFFLDDKKLGGRNGGGRAHANGLPRHASLPKKVGGTKHGNYGFLAGAIHHGQSHAALLDIHDRGRGFTLRVNGFALAVIHHFSRYTGGVEKILRIKQSGSAAIPELHGFHHQAESASRSRALFAHVQAIKGLVARLCRSEQRLSVPVSKMWNCGVRKSGIGRDAGLGGARRRKRPADLKPWTRFPYKLSRLTGVSESGLSVLSFTQGLKKPRDTSAGYQ
jgi:hypothetical protein